MDDPTVPRRLDEAITMVGTCMDMCPRFERYRRERENNLDKWEVVSRNASRAVFTVVVVYNTDTCLHVPLSAGRSTAMERTASNDCHLWSLEDIGTWLPCVGSVGGDHCASSANISECCCVHFLHFRSLAPRE